MVLARVHVPPDAVQPDGHVFAVPDLQQYGMAVVVNLRHDDLS